MRYSLSSRFRGCLLGAMGRNTIVNSDDRQLEQLEHRRKMILLGAESLIKFGRFNLADWRDLYSTEFTPQYPAKAIISILPLALFYHENEIKLYQSLLAVGEIGQPTNPGMRDGCLAVGYAIAQCLSGKLTAANLIPQTIAFLREPQTQLVQQLTNVQTLLAETAGLERVVNSLNQDVQPNTAIALAFYCFLSSLEDFQLSVRRAVQTDQQIPITSSITAALSAAYNSVVGIPISWRLTMPQAEIAKLSDSLLAVWSGVYNQAADLTEQTAVTAIAAPRIMRSRFR